MTSKRAILAMAAAALLLLYALSTNGALFWLLFWLLVMLLLVSFLSLLWTRATLVATCTLDKEKVLRGDTVQMIVNIRHKCPLPVLAFRVYITGMYTEGDMVVSLPARPFVENRYELDLQCPHVGEYAGGVLNSRVYMNDVFLLYGMSRVITSPQEPLLVLPQVYLTEPLTFSPGESDNETSMARAFEDATMPADLRAFQQGDELKKVHWKLSMRRKELIVRVYEQPQRPDVLLLVDCAPPNTEQADAAEIRDAICEAAASLASVGLIGGAPVRMPLLPQSPVDISVSKPEEIEVVQSALARCDFDGAQEFERVLLLETRRMRRTGSTAIITSRMNPVIADMVLRIRRMGPKVRVLLAGDAKEEMTALLIERLMRNDVEVETIELLTLAGQTEQTA